MKLVEECTGIGDVIREGGVTHGVRYRINRYQLMMPSGLPIPGAHRIEGAIEPGGADLAGKTITLTLEDGRSMSLTVSDAEGRVLAEGHGPGKGCSCC